MGARWDIPKRRKMNGKGHWKGDGGRTRLYTWQVGLADWTHPTPCPSGRVVRAVTGPAKPDAVIQRNTFNPT